MVGGLGERPGTHSPTFFCTKKAEKLKLFFQSNIFIPPSPPPPNPPFKQANRQTGTVKVPEYNSDNLHFNSRCPVKERAASLLSTDDGNEAITDQQSNGFTSVEHLALDTGLRFKMPSQQKKNADVLLQEMFEDELEEDDIGPKDLEDLDELDESDEILEGHSRRRLTFHTVDAE